MKTSLFLYIPINLKEKTCTYLSFFALVLFYVILNFLFHIKRQSYILVYHLTQLLHKLYLYHNRRVV